MQFKREFYVLADPGGIIGAFFRPHSQRVNFTLCFFYADCLQNTKIHVPLQPAKEEAVVH
jgi:hypothetical protein